MKAKVFVTLLTVLTGSALGFAQSKYVPEDDIYYQPNKSNEIVERKKAEAQQATRPQTSTSSYSTQNGASSRNNGVATTERDVDEYNRRGNQEYAEPEYNYTEENVIYEDEPAESGYYLNGFNGSNSDFEYAERIRKFHNPKFTIHISDPAYTDIYFLNGMDWNVYVDGNYAWVTPTWTNRWSWDYMWSPFSYTSLAWRWNRGWNSWGWNHWGWGCSPYFGYNDWYWGNSWGPSWGHHPNWGHNPNWGHRPSYPGNHKPQRPNYGHNSGNQGGSRPVINPNRNNNRYDGSYSRPATERPAGSLTRPAQRPSNENGSVTRPSGSGNRPSGNGSVTRPSGNGTRPSGNVTRPSGNVTRPSGNVTRPSGNVTRPSGNSNSRPSSDRVTRPSQDNNEQRKGSYGSNSDSYNSGRNNSGSSFNNSGSSGGSSRGSSSGSRTGGRR